jgi:hypothetical protein
MDFQAFEGRISTGDGAAPPHPLFDAIQFLTLCSAQKQNRTAQ